MVVLPMDQNIEELLLSKKILTQADLDAARADHIASGKSVEDILIGRGVITRDLLTQIKAEYLGVPFVDLATKEFDLKVGEVIPESLARRFLVVPFAFDDQSRTVSLAMANPLDLPAIDFVEKTTRLRVIPFTASLEAINEQIDKHYKENLTSQVTQAIEESPELKENEITDISQINAENVSTDAGVAKIVNAFLDYAVKSRASDVHIEPLSNKTRVRYRIDGILFEKLTLPARIHDSVVARIKILSQLKIDEKRLPQDGRFNFKSGKDEVDLRISTLPTVNGEKVVMRLLKKSGGVPTLADLGIRGTALKNLEIAMLRPHGVIIVCGPTGSGKTTTLYAVLSKINSAKVNIVTLEDPVEYQIPGVNQVQINPLAGLTFASGLRSFLRQDPNIILVGEVRDEETTDLAIQAALTGHLVFTTLHTNNASGALPRLLDLKAEPFLLASSVNAVVGQRICRRVCPTCKQEYEPPSEIIEDIKKVLGNLLPSDKKITLYRGAGCDQCGHVGYLGRVGIFEVLPVDEKVATMILERASVQSIESQAVTAGMITMKQDGYLKAIEGITTMEEVLRVAQD